MEHSPVLSEISVILSESFSISLKHVQAIKVSGDVPGDTPAPVGMEFFCGSKRSAKNASQVFPQNAVVFKYTVKTRGVRHVLLQ